jgi:hypothetical protein
LLVLSDFYLHKWQIFPNYLTKNYLLFSSP